MTPRDHHFFFAKQLIPTHTFQSPDKMFAELTGPQREAFVMFLWEEAGKAAGPEVRCADVGRVPGEDRQGVVKLDVVGAVTRGETEVVVISMPPAIAPNEAIFIALVRQGGQARVFFYERCMGEGGGVADDEAVLSEVRADQSRTNYGFKQGDGLSSFLDNLGQVLGVSLEGLEGSLPPTDMASFIAAGGGPGRARVRNTGGGGGGVGGFLEKLLLLRAGLPVFLYAVGFVLGPLLYQFGGILNVAVGLLGLAIMVLTLIWLYQVHAAHRDQASFSPGMAVGGWFIPLANLVLPPLIVRSAWKAVHGSGGTLLAFAWWAFWLAEVALHLLASAGFTIARDPDRGDTWISIAGETFDLPSALGSVAVMGYSFGSMAVTVGAYGLLWFIVRRINQRRA